MYGHRVAVERVLIEAYRTVYTNGPRVRVRLNAQGSKAVSPKAQAHRLPDAAEVRLDDRQEALRVVADLLVDAHFEHVLADATVTLSAAVVRATVARVDAEGIKYETALSLAGDLVLCDQLTEAAMQEAEPAEAPAGAGTAAPPPASLAPVVDYTVIVRGVPDAPSLLEGLQANSW